MLDTRLDDDIKNVFDLLSNIQRVRYENIDNEVLSCVIHFFYRCGMLKKEVSITKIGDIICQGKKIQELNPGSFDNPPPLKKNSIPLTNNIIGILKKHIHYLSSVDVYDTSPDAPLFPTYYGENGSKKLYRDLKKYLDKAGFNNINEISRIGLMNYYRDLLETGFNKTDSIEKTVDQFRKKNNTVELKVKNIMPKSKMTKFEELLKHWDEMQFLDFSNKNTIQDYERLGSNLIERMKCKNEIKLEIKQTFLDALKNQKNVFKKSIPKQQASITYQNFTDILKKLFETSE